MLLRTKITKEAGAWTVGLLSLAAAGISAVQLNAFAAPAAVSQPMLPQQLAMTATNTEVMEWSPPLDVSAAEGTSDVPVIAASQPDPGIPDAPAPANIDSPPIAVPTSPPTTRPATTAAPTTAPPTTGAPTTTPATTAGPTSNIPPSTAPTATLAGTVVSVTASQSTVPAPLSPTPFKVGNAGAVVVQMNGTTLVLVAAIPQAGVDATVLTSTSTSLTVRFASLNGTGAATFSASAVGEQLAFQIQGS